MDILEQIKKISILFTILFSVTALGCSSVNTSNSNMDIQDPSNPEAGAFVWGKNDKTTGEPEVEKTNEEILKRQKEVLKRQELEKDRLEKEKQDILRQQQYNEQLRELQR